MWTPDYRRNCVCISTFQYKIIQQKTCSTFYKLIFIFPCAPHILPKLNEIIRPQYHHVPIQMPSSIHSVYFFLFNVSQHTTHFFMLFLFNVSVMFVDQVAYVALNFFQHSKKSNNKQHPACGKNRIYRKLRNQIMRCNK